MENEQDKVYAELWIWILAYSDCQGVFLCGIFGWQNFTFKTMMMPTAVHFLYPRSALTPLPATPATLSIFPRILNFHKWSWRWSCECWSWQWPCSCCSTCRPVDLFKTFTNDDDHNIDIAWINHKTQEKRTNSNIPCMCIRVQRPQGPTVLWVRRISARWQT